MDFKEKYLKYKLKYLELKNQYGGKNKCPYKVGYKVLINGPVGDPYLSREGTITEVHFIRSQEDVNNMICDGVRIDFNLPGEEIISRKYKTTNIELRLTDHMMNYILNKLSLEDLIILWTGTTSQQILSTISNNNFDFYDQPIPNHVTLTLFRLIFPRVDSINFMGRNISDVHFMQSILPIRKLNISNCPQLTDIAFSQLTGIHTLDISECMQNTITDAAFVHLRGIHTLKMSRCNQHTITNAAFVNLVGIKELDMSFCNQPTITDDAFVHLRRIHTLYMSFCRQTDAAFVHLRGIHTLGISNCKNITDSAFAHLGGIHTLNMFNCKQITDAAFVYLEGIQKLNMMWCDKITDAAFVHLRGIKELNMSGCSKITDDAFVHLTGIQVLDISHCFQITENALAHLTGLQKLYLSSHQDRILTSVRRLGIPHVAQDW
jgi:hypothetical protein